VSDDLAAKVAKLADLLDDLDEHVETLYVRTDLDAMGIEELRDVIAQCVALVNLTRIGFRRIAAIVLMVTAQVGVWDANVDAIVEHLEDLIEERPDA